MKIIISISFFFLVFNIQILAQIGELVPDSSFNFTSTISSDSVGTNKLLVMNDGRILCVGSVRQYISPGVYNQNFSVSCFLPDGTIDATFANSGYLTIDSGYNDEAFWHVENFDSGYLIIGYYNNAQNNTLCYTTPGGDCFMIKIDQSGNLDASFGNNGIKHLLLNPKLNVADIKFSQNNDIFLLINQQAYFGYTDKGKIIKLNTHGIIDTAFGIQGFAELPIYLPQCMNILGNGSFVVLGADTSSQLQYDYHDNFQSAHLCKLDSSGAIDIGFGINGKKVISFGNAGFLVRTGLSYGTGFYIYGEEGSWGNSTVVPRSIYKFDNLGNFDNLFSGDGRVVINVQNTSGNNSSWPLYSQALKIYNNDLWVFGNTEIYALNCLRKEIIRVSEFGIQDTTLGVYHFSPEPIFDHNLEDSISVNPIYCFEFSGWNDICFQNDGKIVVAGFAGSFDSTITTIPNGFIVSRLIPSNFTTKVIEPSHEKWSIIYPNPASTILHIKAASDYAHLIDLTGKKLFTILMKNGEAQLDISGLANGIYFLIPDAGKASKIIIQH